MKRNQHNFVAASILPFLQFSPARDLFSPVQSMEKCACQSGAHRFDWGPIYEWRVIQATASSPSALWLGKSLLNRQQQREPGGTVLAENFDREVPDMLSDRRC